MACGQAGMPESEFWQAELREVWNRINGFYAAERARMQSDAELARIQTAAIVQMAAKKGRRIKPSDIWIFPWDEEKAPAKIRIMAPEERVDRKADAFIQSLKKQ